MSNKIIAQYEPIVLYFMYKLHEFKYKLHDRKNFYNNRDLPDYVRIEASKKRGLFDGIYYSSVC